jgi:hypothetical protein
VCPAGCGSKGDPCDTGNECCSGSCRGHKCR